MRRKTKHTTGADCTNHVTQFVHYRTGKLMIASEYGYASWPLGSRRKKR